MGKPAKRIVRKKRKGVPLSCEIYIDHRPAPLGGSSCEGDLGHLRSRADHASLSPFQSEPGSEDHSSADGSTVSEPLLCLLSYV
jgi:hypothetical protein